MHGYGLMITIGVLAALFIAEARAKKRDINADVLYPLTLVWRGVLALPAQRFCSAL